MIPSIVRYVVHPLHERLLSRRTFAYLKELEASQWASPDELRGLRDSKLRALLVHAQSRTAFYRRRFARAGVDPTRDEPWDALQRLPILSKPEIRESLDDMVWRDAPGGLFPYDTGGSSGDTLAFYFDRRRQGYDQAARIRSHRWFGVDAGDREAYLWGSPIETHRTNAVKCLRDALCNERLLSAFDMSPECMDGYLDDIERFRPACLFGYPSSLALLVDHARSRGRRMRLPQLRAVFVTGEVCYPHDREALESYFRVPVADGYGSREVGFIAHECPEGNSHVTAENVIVEIVEDGRTVPPGETGEVVVTNLDAYAMPFIRYRTGDVGRLKAGRCACGRGLPMMDVVLGRSTDFLYLPDGNIKHGLSIIYPLRALGGVRSFRVMQDENYAVTVEVVCDERAARITLRSICERLRPVLGDEVELCVKKVERIGTSGSGKYRYVTSRAAGAGARKHQEVSGNA